MKTRLINFLFASIATVLGIMNAQAQTVTWTGEAVPNSQSDYYIVNVDNSEMFLSTGTGFVTKNPAVFTLKKNLGLSNYYLSQGNNYLRYNNGLVNNNRARTNNDTRWVFTSNTNYFYKINNAGIKTKYLRLNNTTVDAEGNGTGNTNLWKLVSEDQYNAVHVSDFSYVNNSEPIATEYTNSAWYVKKQTGVSGRHMEMNFSGDDNKYYYIVVYAKKTGTGNVIIGAENSSIVSHRDELTTEFNKYELVVKTEGGRAKVFFDAEDNNAGTIYYRIESFREENITEVVSSSFWIHETPAVGNFYFYNPHFQKYLKEGNESEDVASKATKFSLSSGYKVSYVDNNGTTIYVYQTRGNAQWGETSCNWTFDPATKDSYAGVYMHSNTGDADRYLRYNGGGIDYVKSERLLNDDDVKTPNTHWQVISEAQYDAMCPTNFIKEQLGYSKDKRTAATVWASECGATVSAANHSGWFAEATSVMVLPTGQPVLTITINGLLVGTYDVDFKYTVSGSGSIKFVGNGTESDPINVKNNDKKVHYDGGVTGAVVGSDGVLKLDIVLPTNVGIKEVLAAITGITCTSNATTEISEGRYYIKNVATGTYLEAGGADGVTAVMASEDKNRGLDFELTLNGGAYYFASFINGGYLNGAKTNGVAKPYYVLPGDVSGTFIISTSNKTNGNISGCLGTNNDGTFNSNMSGKADNQHIQWMFVTKEQRMSELGGATISEPFDASFLVDDNNFGYQNDRVSSWQNIDNGSLVSVGGGNYVMVKEKNFKVTQTLTGIPNGLYMVSVKAVHDDAAQKSPVIDLVANDYSTPIVNDKSGSASASGLQSSSMLVIVTDHTMRLGIESYAAEGNTWFDDFELEYYGESENDDLEMTYLYLNDPKLMTNRWNTTGYWTSNGYSIKLGGDGTDDPDNRYSGRGKFLRGTVNTRTEGLINRKTYYSVAAGSVKQQTKIAMPAGAYKLKADIISLGVESSLYAEIAGRKQKVDIKETSSARKTYTLSFVVPVTGYVTVGFENKAAAETQNVLDVCINNFTIEYLGSAEGADITCQVRDADFNNNTNLSPTWEGTAFTYNKGTASHTNKTFDTYQTVTGLPDGWYRVKMSGSYNGGSGNDKRNAFLYANNASEYVELSRENDNTFITRVTDGNLKIGMKKDATIASDVFAVDSVRLYYLYADLPVGTEVTQFVANPSFETGNATGWTVTGGSVVKVGDVVSSEGNYLLSMTASPRVITQTIKGLPKGYYSLTVNMEGQAQNVDLTASYGAGDGAYVNTKAFDLTFSGDEDDDDDYVEGDDEPESVEVSAKSYTLYGIDVVDGTDFTITVTADNSFTIDHFVLVRNDKIGSDADELVTIDELVELRDRATRVLAAKNNGKTVFGSGKFLIATKYKTALTTERTTANTLISAYNKDQGSVTKKEIAAAVNNLKAAINGALTASPNVPSSTSSTTTYPYYVKQLGLNKFLGLSANRGVYLSNDTTTITFTKKTTGVYYIKNIKGEYMNLSTTSGSKLVASTTKSSTKGAYTFAYYWDENDNPYLTIVSARTSEGFKTIGCENTVRGVSENGEADVRDVVANYGTSSPNARLYIAAMPANPTYNVKVSAALWSTTITNRDVDVSEYKDEFRVYEVTGKGRYSDDDDYIVISEVDKIENNKPYLIHSYKAINKGIPSSNLYPKEKEDNLKNGWLVGNYEDGKILTGTDGAYLLQKQDGVVAFYRANPDKTYKIAPNSAYLVSDSDGTVHLTRLRFVFNEDIDKESEEFTVVESSEVHDVIPVAIYNANGVLISKFEKGLNVVKFSDGTTRKVFLK